MSGRQGRPGFDGQARTALIGGTLLILISFITNYGDHNLLRFTHLALDEQIGVSLHLAAVAALVGVDEVFSVGVIALASRLRDRARNRALEERRQAARDRVRTAREAAREREQAARRDRVENACPIAQCRFLLSGTTRNRLQLNEALALLIEELNPDLP